ncbi:hypothetical protein QBC34DRAFT_419086 [Podospora aff. communis PSN243]|uniref:Mid2 domain-containing protein n=1 Tax=Podospora aff. communis PSN243 TaxID=3040156 RepID=A0AAV9G0H3_9PEZI|nr:hypothetical protein QBC34DRAFT_419086 [Podospora aff. communis PSN243]
MATALTLRNWMFTGPGNDFVCPTWSSGFKCNPTAACASDNATGRQYCCEDQQGMCWNQAATCATDGSTFNCTRGTSTWCCMTNTEICTEAAGQINICWAANPRNVLLDIAPNALRSAYSSLTAARPTASSYTFDPELLMAATTSASSSSSTSRVTDAAASTSTGSSSTTEQTPTTRSGAGAVNSGTNTPTPDDDKGLGAGAIAGIVVGVILAIAIGAALAWFFMRKKNRKSDNLAGADLHEADSTHPSEQKYMYAGSSPGYAEAHPPTAEEMPTPVQDHNAKQPGVWQVVGELPAAHQHYYAEMPAETQAKNGPAVSPQR